jgi:glyoxylase-like metal-dependent hydrolase (beta-lactamase superfamily II)
MIQVEQFGSVIALRMARRFLGKPLYWTTAYWVDGLLIDTGPAVTAQEFVRVLKQVPVRQIALTHCHEDHIGGLPALRQRYPEVPVYASLRTREVLEQPELLNAQLYRRLIWGAPLAVHDVTPLEEVEDLLHTPRYTFRSIETPGHSRDHVSYFEPQQRWLFSGDAFIGGKDQTWAREYDLFSIIGSLQTLALLNADRLFPGSGTVRRAPTNDILDKINYLTDLARQVAKLDVEGADGPTIAEQLLEPDGSMSFWTQRHFTALNLIEACRSYNSLMIPSESRTSSGSARGSEARDDAARQSPRRSTDTGDVIR